MSARDTGVAPAQTAYPAGRMAGAQLDAQGVETAWPQVHRWAAYAQAARSRARGTAVGVAVVCVADGLAVSRNRNVGSVDGWAAAGLRIDCTADGGAAGRVLAVRSADGGVAA